MPGATRTQLRAHLPTEIRIERLEEDADEFEAAMNGIRLRLNWLIGLVFTLTIAIFSAILTFTAR